MATIVAPQKHRVSGSALDAAVDELKQLLGEERVSTAQAVRDHHGRDESWHPTMPPDAVIFPETTEEVANAVTICAAYGVPVIPYGTGTSLEGHVAALEGGVTIDLQRMNKIIRVSPEDLDCTVQAGVTRKQLNEYLRDTGLFFPIDPGADASIGGMSATRASGTNAVRYGTMRENVMGLTVVLADGRIIKTGGRARKSSAGYDLTRMFVGSEGTLGIMTEITLRLYGIPEAMSAAVCSFKTLEGAVDTVIQVMQSSIPMARIELLDDAQMDAINRYSKLDYPVAPTLLFEFHGTEAGVKEQAEIVRAFAEENGGGGFQWATTQEDRSRLWNARHMAYYAALGLRPGARGLTSDVCVPISELARCIHETKADLANSSLQGTLVGHVGDGNFHMLYLIDPDNPAELSEAEGLHERLVHRAIACGGTCTGEHGVGYGKIPFLQTEHGAAMSAMRQLKRAFDPSNILNPGKIVRI